MWAAVINFERQGKADAGEAEAKSGSSSKKGARYIVDVLANCAEDTVPGHGPKRCLSQQLKALQFVLRLLQIMCSSHSGTAILCHYMCYKVPAIYFGGLLCSC